MANSYPDLTPKLKQPHTDLCPQIAHFPQRSDMAIWGGEHSEASEEQPLGPLSDPGREGAAETAWSLASQESACAVRTGLLKESAFTTPLPSPKPSTQ